jgi:uncharacterized protein YgiM (DUF1202 family)
MKVLQIVFLFVLTCALFSCGNDSESARTGSDASAEQAEVSAPGKATDPVAICLWDKAGLREKPGAGTKDNAYLATMVFGETVGLTGESVEVAEEKRTYVAVRLSDGKEGWVNAYLLALNAQLAAAVGPIELYRRPDLLTAKGERFEAGELLAIIPGDNPDWVEVMGKEKKREGWVQKSQQMTEDKVDVAVAVLYAQAMGEKNPAKRETLLQSISENTSFGKSQLIRMIDDALVSISSQPALADNQMRIQATNLNVRSAPSTEGENVIFKLNEGDICTILEKGDQQKIDEMNDYWYRISFNGQEGWVYGYHTSQRAE